MGFQLAKSVIYKTQAREASGLSHFPANVTPPFRQAFLGAYGGGDTPVTKPKV